MPEWFRVHLLLCASVGTLIYSESPAQGETDLQGLRRVVVERGVFAVRVGGVVPVRRIEAGWFAGVDAGRYIGRERLRVTATVDFFYKDAVELFMDVKPRRHHQSALMVPVLANFAYSFLGGPAEQIGAVLGAGAGYYLWFYKFEYQSGEGGIYGPVTDHLETGSDGGLLASVFVRFFAGRVLIEPRMLFAARTEQHVAGGFRSVVSPTAFLFSIGYEYR